MSSTGMTIFSGLSPLRTFAALCDPCGESLFVAIKISSSFRAERSEDPESIKKYAQILE
jgi:hypothetical protein